MAIGSGKVEKALRYELRDMGIILEVTKLCCLGEANNLNSYVFVFLYFSILAQVNTASGILTFHVSPTTTKNTAIALRDIQMRWNVTEG